jgi:hypothetical protein
MKSLVALREEAQEAQETTIEEAAQFARFNVEDIRAKA